MLILARGPGQRVMIGDDVSVTIVEVTGQTVRLGIAGPAEIPVYREEIWLAVQAENQAAAKSAANALPADLPSQAGAHGNGPATKITAAPVDEPAPADEPAPVDDTDPAV